MFEGLDIEPRLIMCSGPNWIHGTDHNPILDLAKETNTVAISPGEESSVIDNKGQLMNQEKELELNNVVWGIIADAFKYSHEAKDVPSDRSLKDYFVEQIKDKELSDEDKDTVLSMAAMWGSFVGDPFEKQSLKVQLVVRSPVCLLMVNSTSGSRNV
jgi:hypothetical protein